VAIDGDRWRSVAIGGPPRRTRGPVMLRQAPGADAHV
jgi:hypothetical protein